MENVRQLFMEAVKDGKLRSYVILNFKPSKLDRPVMSWSEKEWAALLAKFGFFRDTLIKASENDGFYLGAAMDKFLHADSALWGPLEDDLAARILKDYRRG